jgi:hypothetical protein
LAQVKNILEGYRSNYEKHTEAFKLNPVTDVHIIDISPEIETFKFVSDDIEVLLSTAFNIAINFDLGVEMEFKGTFLDDNRLVAEVMRNIINGVEGDERNENKQEVFDLFKDLAQR